jgi:lambda family phage portal protein
MGVIGTAWNRALRSMMLGRTKGGLQASYAGASYNRLTQDWFASLLSADRELKGSLRTLRARSRQLVRDNPHAAAFVNLVKTNVVGPDGIRLQSRITKGDGVLRKTTNQAIEEAWAEWSEAEYCTADGRLTWEEVQQLAMATVAIDGECLIRRRKGYVSPSVGPNPFGYALQFIDADQLDETFNRPRADGSNGVTLNEIRMGVEIDRDGRPVAYHLWQGHPSEAARGMRKPVPADEIIHLFVSLRAGQTRGVPWLTPVMLRLNMLDGLEENELVASRTASANPVFFEVMPEFADAWADTDADAKRGPLEMEMQPGVGTQLPVGLRANQLNPTHPTTAFAPFVKGILRSIAAGIGVSYNSLTNDLESVNYSSIRAGLLQERDGWKALQKWLSRHLCRPVFKDFLAMASVSGALGLPSLDVSRWCAPVWQARGWAWVDPLNDITASALEIQLGLNNRQAICGERGRDFEENVLALAEEQRIADENGVVLGTDPAIQKTETTVENPNMPGQGGNGSDGEDDPSTDTGDGQDRSGKQARAAVTDTPLLRRALRLAVAARERESA